MKYFIKTYGCQMNVSDSERIISVLESAGYKKTLQESNADLIVLNVCSVRQSAIDRIFGNVKKYNKYKKNNPNFKVVITGCILENDRKKFEKLFDLIVDIKEIEKLPALCHPEFVSGSTEITRPVITMPLKLSTTKIGVTDGYKQKILKQVQNDNIEYFKITPRYQNKITAYVPIMTGCNNFCSYCIVPYTRGKEYSRPAEDILREITDLINKGYKEIVLLGQNVNSYETKYPISKIPNYKSQITNYNPINFPKLLKLISDIPGNFWIRFLTSHPKDMTEELIKTVSECEKCAEYIHLALQSGDNDILKTMNRRYTAEHFLKLIKLVRKYIPNVAISTDIIVGFPEETEDQFQNTARVMREAKFDMAYINKYSPRAGTTAVKLNNNVSWLEKKRREKILTEILKETALKNNKKYVEKIVDVLICESRIGNRESGIIYGKTRNFKNVKITVGSIVSSGLWSQNAERNKPQSANANGLHSPEAGTMEPTDNSNLVGQFIKVKITKAGAWGLEGEIIKI